jgi:hypothetical protein
MPDGAGPTAECDIETRLKLWTEHAALARQYDKCAAESTEAPDQCNRVIDMNGHLLQACDHPVPRQNAVGPHFHRFTT